VPAGAPKTLAPGEANDHGETAQYRTDEAQRCSRCGAWRGQLGLEATPDEYVEHLVEVFREVARVLRDDGTLWLVLGDSYCTVSHGPRGHNAPDPKLVERRAQGTQVNRRPLPGLKHKDLVGIPWMVAFALRADGWYLRSDILWAKKNALPESVTDRVTRAHEYVFMLTRQPRYFYDHEAIKEPLTGPDRRVPEGFGGHKGSGEQVTGPSGGRRYSGNPYDASMLSGRNKRSVWNVSSRPYPGAHFACVDTETECLTIGGWRRYDQIKPGDKIFSFNMLSGVLEIQPVQDVSVYDYRGDLVSVFGRSSNMLLTPNHRCVVLRRDKKGGLRTPAIVRADELKSGMKFPVAAPLSEEGLVAPRWPLEFTELVGWVVAEGEYTAEGEVFIWQSETANSEHCARLREISAVLGAKEMTATTRDRETKGRVAKFVLHGKLRKQMKLVLPDKFRVPEHFLLLPRDHLWAFLRGFLKGDGHLRSDGRWSIGQKAKQPLDLLQAMLLRLGRSCVLSQRGGGEWTAFVTDATSRYFKNSKSSLICNDYAYHGLVWCPQVQNGTWVARRGGRPFVTGNTFPSALIEPCILAGTSARGCCPLCGVPWRRKLARAMKPVARTDILLSDRDGGMTVEQGWERSGMSHFKYDQWLKANSPRTVGWEPQCGCPEHEPVPCTVLDPFSGSGTTGLVALDQGRNFVGLDLNADYVELARARILGEQPPAQPEDDDRDLGILNLLGVEDL
jgi:DNA modification methylase